MRATSGPSSDMLAGAPVTEPYSQNIGAQRKEQLLSDYEPPHAGWWRASDDNWYPPESHPDRISPSQPPSPVPPAQLPLAPAPPAPAGQQQPPAPAGQKQQPAPAGQKQPPAPAGQQQPPAPTGGVQPLPPSPAAPGQRSWTRRKWVQVAGAAVAVAVVASIAISTTADVGEHVDSVEHPVAGSGDVADDDTTPGDGRSTDVSPAEDQEAPRSSGAANVNENGANNTAVRSDSGPFAFGSPVPVVFQTFGDADGSVWNVRVNSPQDVTQAVLASNDFNDPPPEGVVFAGFGVEMTLASAGKEPLSPGFNFSWEILGGSTSAVYDPSTLDGLFGCGVMNAEFNDYAEVFVGGTLTGTVCIPLPEDDLADPSTQVAMNFSGERVTFSSSGDSPVPASIASAGGSATTGAELALGMVVPIEFDAFGDADGSVWNVMVSPLRDMTDEVLDANPFNNEPIEGVAYVGFDVEMTLARAGKVPLSSGFNLKWEILGAATASVYDVNTIADLFGCGVIRDGFNELAEVFVGGTVAGTVCIPLPVEDLSEPDTRIAFNFGGNRILFSPDGSAPEPAEIESGGGPASIVEGQPNGVAIDVKWDSFGDADRSIWTTTVSDLRDITAEVLAANPFNDAPPDGVAMLGFDVEMTLVESQKEPLSAGFNVRWEVLGGETRRVYNATTNQDLLGCGVVDNEFDQYAEVFAGGTLSGTVCIPVPLADLGHPDTRISMGFDDSRVVFLPS